MQVEKKNFKVALLPGPHLAFSLLRQEEFILDNRCTQWSWKLKIVRLEVKSLGFWTLVASLYTCYV